MMRRTTPSIIKRTRPVHASSLCIWRSYPAHESACRAGNFAGNFANCSYVRKITSTKVRSCLLVVNRVPFEPFCDRAVIGTCKASISALFSLPPQGRGTDLSVYPQAHLNKMARQLNGGPRQSLQFETSTERFDVCIASTG